MIGNQLIVWNENFDTGVTEIDEQHRTLVNIINKANSRLATDFNAAMLDEVTRDLSSYAHYHFDLEESLMKEYNYTEDQSEDSATHLREHGEFSTIVASVREGIKAGNLIPREYLLLYLNSWLINHILYTDKRLAAFVLARRGAIKE